MTCRWRSRTSGDFYLETLSKQPGVLSGEDRLVPEVMDRRIVVIKASCSLWKAVETMHGERVPTLIVKDEVGLHGLLTQQDLAGILIKRSEEWDASARTVNDVLWKG